MITYDEKIKWINDYLPFIKLDHDIVVENMKISTTTQKENNKFHADAMFGLSNRMLDLIAGEKCTYNILLSIHIFPDRTNPKNLMYSTRICSAKSNFILETYTNSISYIEKNINPDDFIFFSDKEFIMIRSPDSTLFVEEMLNKLILLFCYPSYYKTYNNFFMEKAEDDIKLIAMASI